jgi:fermentation-respiration switch protein FrsA (DUF1100 family)
VRLLSLLALAGITMLAAFSLRHRLVDSMVFQPTRGVDLRPSQLGIEGEEIVLETEDGVRIHAFYLPAAGAGRGLLFLHGNAGNASHRLPNAAELVRLGVHVLLLDYRGYGASEGSPSEAGAYADARAGLSHLVRERGIPEQRIVVFGRSLGGAVAVDLAAGRDLAGVILESTFPSMRAVARSLFGPLLAGLASDKFDSLGKISRLRAPLLFFHGDRDEIIDFELGRQLFEAAPEPKAFEAIRGAGHNDTVEVGGRPYFARIQRFLDEVAPEAPRPGSIPRPDY